VTLTITNNVDSHYINQDYECLLVDLLNEQWFHYQIENGELVKADVMPSDKWVLELCEKLASVSPSFRFELWCLAGKLGKGEKKHK